MNQNKLRIRRGNIKDATEVKKFIKDAAINLLMRDGLESISMRAIAQFANISAMTIYQHYESKSELLYECIIDKLNYDISKTNLISLLGDEKLAIFFSNHIHFWTAHSDFFKVMFFPVGKVIPIVFKTKFSDTKFSEHHTTTLNIIRQIADENNIDYSRVEDVADFLESSVLGFIHRSIYSVEDELSVEKSIECYVSKLGKITVALL